MTLQEMLIAVMKRAGFTPSVQFVNSNNAADEQLVELANEEIADLIQAHTWPVLKSVWNLTLTTDLEYDLPADWGPPIPDTAWSSSRNWKADLPVSDEVWSYLKTQVNFSGVRYRMRFRNSQLEVHSPSPGDTLRFEYISSQPVLDLSLVGKKRFTKDDDTTKLDDELLIRGVTYRFLQLKEEPWQKAEQKYMKRLAQLRGSSTGSQTINTASPDISPTNPPYADLYR